MVTLSVRCCFFSFSKSCAEQERKCICQGNMTAFSGAELHALAWGYQGSWPGSRYNAKTPIKSAGFSTGLRRTWCKTVCPCLGASPIKIFIQVLISNNNNNPPITQRCQGRNAHISESNLTIIWKAAFLKKTTGFKIQIKTQQQPKPQYTSLLHSNPKAYAKARHIWIGLFCKFNCISKKSSQIASPHWGCLFF